MPDSELGIYSLMHMPSFPILRKNHLFYKVFCDSRQKLYFSIIESNISLPESAIDIHLFPFLDYMLVKGKIEKLNSDD